MRIHSLEPNQWVECLRSDELRVNSVTLGDKFIATPGFSLLCSRHGTPSLVLQTAGFLLLGLLVGIWVIAVDPPLVTGDDPQHVVWIVPSCWWRLSQTLTRCCSGCRESGRCNERADDNKVMKHVISTYKSNFLHLHAYFCAVLRPCTTGTASEHFDGTSYDMFQTYKSNVSIVCRNGCYLTTGVDDETISSVLELSLKNLPLYCIRTAGTVNYYSS